MNIDLKRNHTEYSKIAEEKESERRVKYGILFRLSFLQGL